MTVRRVALLRGINVGGHRRVPMAELRRVLTEQVGLTDVATYIQSGNVVFGGGPVEDAAAEATITAAVDEHFGFEVPVVVRAASVLTELLDRSAELFPTEPDAGTDRSPHDTRVNVGFLTAAPTVEAIAELDPDRSPGDTIVVEGDHAHVAYAIGQSSTKLTGDHIERVLGVGMTMRNLSTVRHLVDLAG